MHASEKLRRRAAARMLGTCRLAVKTVAASVSYSSRSYFSRVFKAAYGVDPTAVRAGSAERIALRRHRAEPS